MSYVYFWHRPEGASRKGQRCEVTARGRMNSIRVEFSDGFKMITSRNAVRKPKGEPSSPPPDTLKDA